MRPHVRLGLKILATALPFLLFIRHGYAQALEEKPNIEYLNLAEGYTFNAATDIIQDSDGFIWISSFDGLVRYDGYRFLTASDFTTLPNKTIFCITQSADGNLWLGHLGGFITRFNPKTFRSETLEVRGAKKFDVVRMMCDRSGRIWASVRGLGLAYCDKAEDGFKLITQPNETSKGPKWYNYISDMADDDKHLWLGGFNGLYQLEKSTLKLDTISALSNSDSLVAIQRIAKIGDDVWAASYGSGIVRYNTKTKTFHKFTYQDGPAGTNNIVNKILSLDDTTLLLATNGKGIGTFNIKNQKFRFYDDPDKFGAGRLVNAAVVDRAGIIWATSDKGLLKWNRPQDHIVFSKLNVGRSDNGAYYGVGDVVDEPHANRKLVGSAFADGLYIIRDEKFSVNGFKTAKGAEPYLIASDLLTDSKKNTWVVTRDFLYRLSPKDELIEETNIRTGLGDTLPYFNRIIETSHGDLVVTSTRLGAFIRGAGQGSWNRITSLRSNRIIRIAEDKQNRLWFLHPADGISVFDVSTHRVSTISASESGDRFTDIAIGQSGDAWISSYDGLFLLRRDNATPTRVDLSFGIPSSVIYSICTDSDDNLWMTTSKGLSALTHDGHVRSFDAVDGLKGINSSFSLRPAIDGKIYIVTFQGFFTFDPKRLLERRAIDGKTVITAVRNNDSLTHAIPESVMVDYRLNRFNIEFAALNYAGASRNTYEYRLSGLDEKWIMTKENSVNYAGLPSGDYTFMVKHSGQPDSSSAMVTISVSAPFWKQKWFLISTIALVASTSYMLYLRRMRRVRDEEQSKASLKERLAEMEMKALRAQMSPHFIFNSLNSINRYIVKSDPETASNYLTKFSKLMRLILENSNQKVISLEQELNALKLYIELEALRFNHKFKHTMHVDKNVDAALIGVPPMIIQPFIENAIWHGLLHKESPGELRIDVTRNGDYVQCIIEDNGVGRKKARELKSKSVSREKSFGLKITEDRLKMADHAGKMSHVDIIDLQDASGQALGTRVILNITIIQLEPEF